MAAEAPPPSTTAPASATTTATQQAPGTWVIVGASRGIGLEFVRQLLARGHQVIAAVRDPVANASQLWQIAGSQARPGSCLIEQCDVVDEGSVLAFAGRLKSAVEKGMRIENVVLNAGVLQYPNRASELTYAQFALHLHTNTIGPIICAQALLNLSPTSIPSRVIFISSDSGSAILFRDFEDGFGAYAASKAALNQMLRHLAAELKRKGHGFDQVSVLAMHPGEVATDMASHVDDLGWDVEGIIQPEESVRGMLQVIESKGSADSGTFWCWDGREHPW